MRLNTEGTAETTCANYLRKKQLEALDANCADFSPKWGQWSAIVERIATHLTTAFSGHEATLLRHTDRLYTIEEYIEAPINAPTEER